MIKTRSKFAVVFCLLYLAFALTGCSLGQKITLEKQQTPNTNQGVSQKANLSIDFGNGETQNFTLEFRNERTVYDFLQKLALQNKIKLEIKESSFGPFLEMINGIRNGQDNKYWLYYVNGKMAPSGMKSQKVSNQDNIEFKFEKSNF